METIEAGRGASVRTQASPTPPPRRPWVGQGKDRRAPQRRLVECAVQVRASRSVTKDRQDGPPTRRERYRRFASARGVETAARNGCDLARPTLRRRPGQARGLANCLITRASTGPSHFQLTPVLFPPAPTSRGSSPPFPVSRERVCVLVEPDPSNCCDFAVYGCVLGLNSSPACRRAGPAAPVTMHAVMANRSSSSAATTADGMSPCWTENTHRIPW